MSVPFYKTVLFTVTTLLLLVAASCNKDDFSTGIRGEVTYGSGDCMPVIDPVSREYEKYNGMLYFIRLSDLDSAGPMEFEQLKENNIPVKVRSGKLNSEIPPGTYVVMTEDQYVNTPENTIGITSGLVLLKDFEFWVCTSY